MIRTYTAPAARVNKVGMHYLIWITSGNGKQIHFFTSDIPDNWAR